MRHAFDELDADGPLTWGDWALTPVVVVIALLGLPPLLWFAASKGNLGTSGDALTWSMGHRRERPEAPLRLWGGAAGLLTGIVLVCAVSSAPPLMQVLTTRWTFWLLVLAPELAWIAPLPAIWLTLAARRAAAALCRRV